LTTWITNKAEVESDAARLNSDDSNSDINHIDLEHFFYYYLMGCLINFSFKGMLKQNI